MNLMAKMRNWKHNRSHSEKGVAAVEFALTLPIWITLLLGTADGTYCLLVNERADRIAYSVTDITTQYSTVSLANLSDIVQAASQLMQPINFTSNGTVIITSIYQPPGQIPLICWQYTGGGSLSRVSKIGKWNGAATCTNGNAASMPNGLTLNDNENVVITEVYYIFTPLFLSANLFSAGDIYRIAIYKPRISPLITPPT